MNVEPAGRVHDGYVLVALTRMAFAEAGSGWPSLVARRERVRCGDTAAPRYGRPLISHRGGRADA
jgi:hypothetical protein